MYIDLVFTLLLKSTVCQYPSLYSIIDKFDSVSLRRQVHKFVEI